MEELRFKTRVSDTGTIQLPEDFPFKNQEVQVIIIPQTSEEGKQNASEFFKKWAGFLSSIEEDDSKYAYLIEKHK